MNWIYLCENEQTAKNVYGTDAPVYCKSKSFAGP